MQSYVFHHSFRTIHPTHTQQYAWEQVREYDKLAEIALDKGFLPDPTTLQVEYTRYGSNTIATLYVTGTKNG